MTHDIAGDIHQSMVSLVHIMKWQSNDPQTPFDCTEDFLSTMKVRDAFFQQWVSLPTNSDLSGTAISWVCCSAWLEAVSKSLRNVQKLLWFGQLSMGDTSIYCNKSRSNHFKPCCLGVKKTQSWNPCWWCLRCGDSETHDCDLFTMAMSRAIGSLAGNSWYSPALM